jgi:hypothetical protein
VGQKSWNFWWVWGGQKKLKFDGSVAVNSMSLIWNDNMREKREANANATWRAQIRDRPRGDGV